MATTLGNGNLITARLNFQIDGSTDRYMNVLHYQVRELVGSPTSVNLGLSEIAGAIHDHFGDAWASTASVDTAFNNVTVTNVYPLPRSVTVTGAIGLPFSGTVTGEPLPAQDAPTILKKTDIGARWGLGRMFVFGTPESGQDGGVLEGAQQALLNTLAGKVDDDIAVVGTGFTCILGPVLVRGPEDNPVSVTKIENAVLSDGIIKTQRRRRPGKGS